MTQACFLLAAMAAANCFLLRWAALMVPIQDIMALAGFVPFGGGNGCLEQQIDPVSWLVTEINQRIFGGQTGPLDQLRGRSLHERLGPHPGFRHKSETGV
jgi:hypothetical protein